MGLVGSNAKAIPVPVNCVVIDGPSLLLTVADPLWPPGAAGENTKDSVHVPPAGNVVPQLFVSANGPLITIEIPVNVFVLPLLSSIVWAAEEIWTPVTPKFKLPGVRVILASSPAPVNATSCVRVESTTVRVPLSAPLVWGSNSTWIVQEPPAGSVAPQVVVNMKSGLPD